MRDALCARSEAATPAYRLNVRVFWPLATCGCTAVLGLLQALRTRAGAAAALLLALLLAYGALRRRRRRRQGAAPEPRPEPAGPPERAALEAFYARRLRASPHVLGHCKAHVRLVLGELGRAGKAGGRLALRGDAVPVGSAFEQHRARSPGAFDVLLPLRLEPRRALRVEAREPGRRGAFVCALRGPSTGAPSPEEEDDDDGEGRRLSAALVLRWFQGHLLRCLGPLRSRLQGRARVSLTMGPGRPLALLVVPPADDVCGRLSLAVRLVPAIPFGESLYLTPLSATHPAASASLAAFWTLDVSRVEQRLLGWLKERSPADACHLKCLQILKGLRDLGGRSLEPPLASQWGRVLSSYALKTALFSLLLRGSLQAWADRFLVQRLEDLVTFLEGALRRRVLRHVFLGNASLPEAIGVPKFLKDAAPVNLLADFDGSALDRVAAQLLEMWWQAPKIIQMYSGHRGRRSHPV